MRIWQQGGRTLFLVVSLMVCGAGTAMAVSGTWTGSVNDQWLTGGNWSSGAYPNGPSDVATFDNAANNRRWVKYDMSVYTWSVKHVLFKTANCGNHTIGTDFATNYRLWLRDKGSIEIDEDVTSNQIIKSYVYFGTSSSGATTYTFRNDSLNALLTLNGGFRFYPSTSTATRTVYIDGVGDITSTRLFYTNGVSPCTVYMRGTGLFTSGQACTINRLHMQAGSLARYCIGSGELFLNNGSSNYSLSAYEDGYIYGAGTLRLGTGTGENFARIYVSSGKTLTIDTLVTSEGGLDLYSGTGTLVLNGINTVASNFVISGGATLSVGKIGNRESTDSNIGCGQCIRLSGNASQLSYTGTGETTDRLLEINHNARLDQSGTGELLFLEDLVVGGTVKTLTLMGSTASAGEIAGVIGPGSATTSLAKEGTGLWRLTAANTYAGSTTVQNGTLALTGAAGALTATESVDLQGGTLHLTNSVAANSDNRLNDVAGVTLNGGTLDFAHDGGAADYSETLGALTVGANDSTVSISQADEGQSATLTFNALARTGRGTINFSGLGLGESDSTRNRILFTNPPTTADGFIGPWATVNDTALAMYDTTRGVYAAPDSVYTNIAARGPDSVIPDNVALNVRITTEGTAGAITLEGAGDVSVYTLTQLAETPAVTEMASRTLFTYSVDIAEGGAALTLGLNADDGTLKRMTTDDGELILANHSTDGTLTVNAVITDNTGVTSLTKKGGGAVAFNGLVSVTGDTLVQAGALTLSNVPGVHALGSSLAVTGGGGQTPTALNIGGATEVLNYGNFTTAYNSGDRCVVTITNDFTVQGCDSSNGRFHIGVGPDAAGAIIQKGGVVIASSGIGSTDYLSIAKTGGYGYYRMTGGSLTSGEIAVGGSGSGVDLNVGIFDLFNGAITVDQAYLLLAWAKGFGVMNMFGGSFSGGETLGGQLLCVYNAGHGSSCMLNLLGPDVHMFKNGVYSQKAIDLSRGADNGLSVVNLNNGILTLRRAYVTATGTTTHFNFNGGTLKAAATYTQLMQGLSAAVVYQGGAKIDTDGYDVILNQPLMMPTGYGVTAIALSSGGTDYIGAPAVQIKGGSGVGATAIALVDLEAESPTCGQVTNILVTSAGFGYAASDTLAVTLLRGGCLTPATLGAITLGANEGGGVVKSGEGILTLGGGGTYSGTTIVSNGTLLVNGSHAGGGEYTFISGTTLGGNGTVTLASGTVNLLAGATLTVDPVSDAGDRLTVSSLTLSDNLVTVAQIDSLDKKELYPILTCTGTITGALATHIADSPWGVKLVGDTFYLHYKAGNVIIIR